MNRLFDVFDMHGFRIGSLYAASTVLALEAAKRHYPLKAGLMVEDVEQTRRRLEFNEHLYA